MYGSDKRAEKKRSISPNVIPGNNNDLLKLTLKKADEIIIYVSSGILS